MADERDEDQFDTEGQSKQQTTGQQGQQNELGQQQGQQAGGLGSQQSMSGQDSGSQGSDLGAGSGQPIGGNDSRTGSGTTMSQGADFGGQSATGQTQSGGSSGTLENLQPGYRYGRGFGVLSASLDFVF